MSPEWHLTPRLMRSDGMATAVDRPTFRIGAVTRCPDSDRDERNSDDRRGVTQNATRILRNVSGYEMLRPKGAIWVRSLERDRTA